jgi:hypothetical protein
MANNIKSLNNLIEKAQETVKDLIMSASRDGVDLGLVDIKVVAAVDLPNDEEGVRYYTYQTELIINCDNSSYVWNEVIRNINEDRIDDDGTSKHVLVEQKILARNPEGLTMAIWEAVGDGNSNDDDAP